MYGSYIIVPVLILVSQSLASTVETHLTTAGPSLAALRQDHLRHHKNAPLNPRREARYKRDDGDNLIGYFIEDGEISEYRCQNTDLWLGDTSVPGRRSTYAHCSGRSAIPGDSPPIGTTCSGNAVFWANMDGRTLAGSSSRGKYSCITVTVYDSYDDGSGSGPQYWIDCEENLRPPRNIREFYRTMPEQSISSTTELNAAGTTDPSFPPSTAPGIASVNSSQATSETASGSTRAATDTTKPSSGKGLGGGAIAGIALGSFFGGVLLTSSIAVLLMRRQVSVASQSGNGMETVGGSQMELVDRGGYRG
ncbi:uncharacterized protein NECHADRAFT_87126 [Fusarium vanettenii 77-13-4]|uniref:Ig-like domain-containing protein n=1 Tax=Fusarium vanettenii (strain ATCC MYA-4622 / CBS 123669 / FGSC 9596 / NRRL 45880 / 77-13-4) TaxID=660122 RepID=C7ZIF7_FUSV7|nr:uncharacterized protein NECHADRAFT_87126 [Fusarium vanettenii 77-13-4]EEU36194.1 predicted protein [Fusarium vanettenii 77-13-4]